MFMKVITGYLSTFKVIQGHIFLPRSNKFSKMCVLLYTIDIPNIKRISLAFIEISLERTNFKVSSLGDLKMVCVV